MQTFARWASDRDLILWDVGANNGGWASEAAHSFPHAAIHSFEIVPNIADEYERRQAGNPNTTLHRFGLSDAETTVDVSYNVDYNTTSSITYRDTKEFGTDIQTVACDVKTVASIVGSTVPAPDLLKIDTEGHDFAVLRGAADLLDGPDAPAMIQFEYGETCLPGGETVEKCHRYLTNKGYALGRLYPNHVEFKDYSYEDAHYRTGNMIAVKDAGLRALLSGG